MGILDVLFHRQVTPTPAAPPPPPTPVPRPPLPGIVEVALREYGVSATPGPETTPRILQYLQVAGLSGEIHDDETAWCGTFVSYCAASAGYLLPKGNAGARNWLSFGVAVETPRLGDVVVFWRNSPDSWEGHVAIYITERSGNIYVLGGNQGRQVSIIPMPKERVLGYRRPQ